MRKAPRGLVHHGLDRMLGHARVVLELHGADLRAVIAVAHGADKRSHRADLSVAIAQGGHLGRQIEVGSLDRDQLRCMRAILSRGPARPTIGPDGFNRRSPAERKPPRHLREAQRSRRPSPGRARNAPRDHVPTGARVRRRAPPTHRAAHPPSSRTRVPPSHWRPAPRATMRSSAPGLAPSQRRSCQQQRQAAGSAPCRHAQSPATAGCPSARRPTPSR